MSHKLQNQVALVTGGSRGIGASIAKILAREGAKVLITYQKGQNQAEEVVQFIQKQDGEAQAIQADSNDMNAVKKAIQKAIQTYGRLDILVNNAGIAMPSPLNTFPENDFDKMINVNLKAPFYATQEAAQFMQEGGRIIMIGSVNAERMPFPDLSVYATTKAGLAGMTRGLARDLGQKGITVNCIQPGPIDTDMNPADGKLAHTAVQYLALKRYGKVEEVAELVLFLASREASFITGACYTVDGGFLA